MGENKFINGKDSSLETTSSVKNNYLIPRIWLIEIKFMIN